MRHRGRWPPGTRILLPNDHLSVDGNLRQLLIATVGPGDLQAVDDGRAAEAKVRSLIDAGHEAAIGRLVDVLLLLAGDDADVRTDAPSVRRLAVEAYAQKVMRIVAREHVLVDECRRV